MIILISIITLIFLFSAFLKSPDITVSNPFISYFFFQLNLLFEYFLFFIAGFLLLFSFFIRKFYRNTRHISYTLLYHACIQTCSIIIISAFAAFTGLFFVAVIQLNICAILLNVNPSLLGVTTDTTTIVKMLQKQHAAPFVITTNTSQKETIAVAKTSVGTESVYKNIVLSAVPDFLILPVRKFSGSFLFLDNTLIVTQLTMHDLQLISPLIGYLFVQEYFPTRHIQSFPKVLVMTQKDFAAKQTIDAKAKQILASQDIQKMEDGIASISAVIKNDNDAILTNQNLSTVSMKQRNTEYNACLSTGHYTGGTFIPTNTKEYCQKILDTWNLTLSEQDKDANKLTLQLQKDEQQLKDYQYYDTFFKTQKALIAITANSIPDELGVFQPPNAIKIVFSKNNSPALDYFETLTHEYLHFASYVSGKRFDSSFFEEGFTEYFARKTIQDNMHASTNFAYPAQEKIIEAMTKRIAESDLADYYFAKDETGLENALNLAFGDNFYKDNYILFQSMMYEPDQKQQIQFANAILKHMDEQPIQEKDVFSQ